MSVQTEYKFLEPRQRSNYKQLWVRGRHVRAEVLYRYTVGPEPETPEQVAQDYDLPVEAVLEAIDYCTKNKDLLDAERVRGEQRVKELGLDKPPYKFLEPRRGSSYRQLFLKGRNTRAEVIYRYTVGPEPMTPEEVAEDCNIPLEMVLEAIHYSIHNKEVLDADRAMEQASIREMGLDKPPYVPPDYRPDA